jgi:hypothetical protein
VGIVAALAIRADDRQEDRSTLRPGAGPGEGRDPLAYRDDRREAFEERAARGLAHPLFAKSPGGAVATARRVAQWRPQVEAAAARGDVDPDVLEGIVFLESAGRADARASNDLEGAVGLTQILAETGQNLLGMRVDVQASERLTRGIARGRRVAARERERRLVDERFDPVKSLAATVRYLNIAKGELAGRDDLAVAGYHMGIGNLQTALARFERGTDIPYAELYFGATPLSAPRTHAFLSGLGDDSSTYLWRVRAAQRIMRTWRRDPAALAVQAGLHEAKNSAEEVLHPPSTTEVLEDPGALEDAREDGRLEPLDPAALGEVGLASTAGWGARRAGWTASPRCTAPPGRRSSPCSATWHGGAGDLRGDAAPPHHLRRAGRGVPGAPDAPEHRGHPALLAAHDGLRGGHRPALLRPPAGPGVPVHARPPRGAST